MTSYENRVKKILSRAALVPALALALFAQTANAEIVDRVVAVVNDEIILLSDLAKNAAPYEERAAAEARDPVGRALARKEVRERILDDMVADKLVEQQARELGVTTSDAEVATEIERIKKQNGVDDAEFMRQVAAQGMTMADMREYVRKARQRQKVIEARVQPRIVISEAEVRAYYAENFKNDDEVRVRMISKRIPAAASDAERTAVLEEVRKLRAQVTGGGRDFEAVARTESEGPNPAQGGDLGWFRRGDVAEEIEEIAFTLDKGQVSPPIELGGAYHILQLVDRREAAAKPFDEVKDRIRSVLFNREGEKEYERWIAELRNKSFVEVRLDGPVPAEDTGTPAAAKGGATGGTSK